MPAKNTRKESFKIEKRKRKPRALFDIDASFTPVVDGCWSECWRV
jgi:hypothetical protein